MKTVRIRKTMFLSLGRWAHAVSQPAVLCAPELLVLEGPRDWFPGDSLLRDFGTLRVVAYDVTERHGDFFPWQSMPIVRFLAQKMDD